MDQPFIEIPTYVQILEGANLHLVILFLIAGVALIVAHALVSAWLKRRARKAADG